MIKLLVLLLFTSCASTKKAPSLAELETRVEKNNIKKIAVANRSEALREIYKHHNFLKLLFEQTRDPYYGTPKWSDACLKGNEIGSVLETEESISLISNLFLLEGAPGACPEHIGAKRVHRFLVYCEGDGFVTDLIVPFDPKLKVKGIKLCP